MVDKRKNLVKSIETLTKDEHIGIFKLIRENTDKYTINDNGIFINLSILDDNVIDNLCDYIEFCEENRKDLERQDKKIETEKNNISHDQEENITTIITKNQEEKIPDEPHSELDGTKVSLKKTKPKYTGLKAKLIKKYKQNNTKISTSKKTRKEPKDLSNNEYDIGEEEYNCLTDDDSDIEIKTEK